MPPDTTAPVVSRMLPFIATAMGTAMGIMMENDAPAGSVQKAIQRTHQEDMMAGQKAPSMRTITQQKARNWQFPFP